MTFAGKPPPTAALTCDHGLAPMTMKSQTFRSADAAMALKDWNHGQHFDIVSD